MANVFDASIVNEGKRRGRSSLFLDEACRGDIDWARGLQGVPKPPRRKPDASGGLLTKVIEGEIIPRLLLAHRTAAAKTGTSPADPAAKCETIQISAPPNPLHSLFWLASRRKSWRKLNNSFVEG